MKKYAIGIFILILAVSASAFVVNKESKPAPLITYWYEYEDVLGNSPSDPADYHRTAGGRNHGSFLQCSNAENVRRTGSAIYGQH